MTSEIQSSKIAIFQKKEIRKTIYKNEWWFSVIDIVEVLTGTERPRKYWNDLKKKLMQEGCFEVSEKIGQLKLAAPDGKMRETDCANKDLESLIDCLLEKSRIILKLYGVKGFLSHPQIARLGLRYL
jgi:hypothetical protein